MEQLEKYFDTAFGAPEGILKLRALILNLAMKGLLVNSKEKDQNISPSRKIEYNGHTALKSDSLKEVPFELPQEWKWVNLGDICDINGGFAFKSSNYVNNGVRVVRISDFDERGFKNDKVVRYIYSNALSAFELFKNSILMAMTGGTVGKSLLVKDLPEKMVVNQRVATIKPSKNILPSFLHFAIQAEFIQQRIQTLKNSTNDNISMSDIKGFPIPLPSVQTQTLIVSKINKLMSHCDELEKLRAERDQKRLGVHTAAIRKMLDAPDQATFDDAWQFITRHFGTLYTVRENVAELRKAILQLAVMGKLVKQDAREGTARELMDKLVSQRNHLIKKGAIRRSTIAENGQSDGQISNSSDIPNSWEWVNLKQLGYFLGGKTPSKNKPTYWNGSIPWVSPKDMKSPIIQDSEDHVTESGVKSGLPIIPANSILMVVRSGILRRAFPVARNKIDCTINQDLKGLVPYSKEITPYLLLMFRGFESNILSKLTKQGVTVESVKFDEFVFMPFPIPPLLEQNRIVDKVKNFMQFCDNLDQQIDVASRIQGEVLEAVMAEEN